MTEYNEQFPAGLVNKHYQRYVPRDRELAPRPADTSHWYDRDISQLRWHTLLPAESLRIAEPDTSNVRTVGIAGFSFASPLGSASSAEIMQWEGELASLTGAIESLRKRWNAKHASRAVTDATINETLGQLGAVQDRVLDIKEAASGAKNVPHIVQKAQAIWQMGRDFQKRVMARQPVDALFAYNLIGEVTGRTSSLVSSIGQTAAQAASAAKSVTGSPVLLGAAGLALLLLLRR